MQNMPHGLGNQRYLQLQEWLESPLGRARRVMQVTSAWWWPEGPPVQRGRRKQRAAQLDTEEQGFPRG